MKKNWKALLAWPFGEAALWLLFLYAFVAALDDYRGEGKAMLAAIAALAAIGVRATRSGHGKPE
jgi:hypothetical protein